MSRDGAWLLAFLLCFKGAWQFGADEGSWWFSILIGLAILVWLWAQESNEA